MHKRKEDIRKESNVTESLCHDERDRSVNDISNVRCHGWDMGRVRNEG